MHLVWLNRKIASNTTIEHTNGMQYSKPPPPHLLTRAVRLHMGKYTTYMHFALWLNWLSKKIARCTQTFVKKQMSTYMDVYIVHIHIEDKHSCLWFFTPFTSNSKCSTRTLTYALYYRLYTATNWAWCVLNMRTNPTKKEQNSEFLLINST